MREKKLPLLGGRYQIVSKLGSGAFGTTFLAKDLHRPSKPTCVIKQLDPKYSDRGKANLDLLATAKRLFNTEAEVLESLGKNEQIPELLAYFSEENRFYLVQELIEGHSLDREIVAGAIWEEAKVREFLQEILNVLSFVHQRGVIHRDIKPANLMRRKADNRLFLIDFGAVKQTIAETLKISQGNPTQQPSRTICIGTEGYMPWEQYNGNPQFSSDVYAVGILAIQTLTGEYPQQFKRSSNGEIIWRDRTTVSEEFANIIDKMVRSSHRERYSSAVLALEAIEALSAKEQIQRDSARYQPTVSKGRNSRQTTQIPRKTISISIAIALLMVSAVAVSFYINQRETTVPEETNTPAW